MSPDVAYLATPIPMRATGAWGSGMPVAVSPCRAWLGQEAGLVQTFDCAMDQGRMIVGTPCEMKSLVHAINIFLQESMSRTPEQ